MDTSFEFWAKSPHNGWQNEIKWYCTRNYDSVFASVTADEYGKYLNKCCFPECPLLRLEANFYLPGILARNGRRFPWLQTRFVKICQRRFRTNSLFCVGYHREASVIDPLDNLFDTTTQNYSTRYSSYGISECFYVSFWELWVHSTFGRAWNESCGMRHSRANPVLFAAKPQDRPQTTWPWRPLENSLRTKLSWLGTSTIEAHEIFCIYGNCGIDCYIFQLLGFSNTPTLFSAIEFLYQAILVLFSVDEPWTYFFFLRWQASCLFFGVFPH